MEIVFYSEPNPPGTANDSTCLCPGWWPTRSATTRGSTTQTSPSCGDTRGQHAMKIQFRARVLGRSQRTLPKQRPNYETCAKKELKRWSCCYSLNVGCQVIRVAAAREELQKARTKHSGARDQLEGKALAPFFSSNIQFIAFACLLQQFIVTLCLWLK